MYANNRKDRGNKVKLNNFLSYLQKRYNPINDNTEITNILNIDKVQLNIKIFLERSIILRFKFKSVKQQ